MLCTELQDTCRWSTSCWNTLAWKPSSSPSTQPPSAVCNGTVAAGQAVAAHLVGDPHRAPPLDGGGQPGRAGVAALHPNWAGLVSQPWCANRLAITIFLLTGPQTLCSELA